jgi:hypothetical protein
VLELRFNMKPKKPHVFFCVRDAEGAEGGTSWNERSAAERSAAKYGSEADPGASPTAVGGKRVGKAGTPKK